MSYEVVIRKRAEADIADIYKWYEQRERGLGNYFLLCLDASFETLKRYPTAYRLVRHEYRRIFVRKFPVAVYYIVSGQKINVGAIEPFSRDTKRLDEKL